MTETTSSNTPNDGAQGVAVVSETEDESSSTGVSMSTANNEGKPTASTKPKSILKKSTNDDSNISGLEDRTLSVTSRMYDAGNKGYLTEAEQRMRELDTSNRGQLKKEQVVQIMEQTMAMRDANRKLRNLVIGLFVAVVMLGLATMGSALAAARLAKDTETDSGTGEMKVKGKSLNVMTQGKGASLTVQVHSVDGDASSSFFCIRTIDLSRLYSTNRQGVAVSLVLENNINDTVLALGITLGGSSFNSTNVIMTSHDGSPIDFDLTSSLCDDLYASGSGRYLEGSPEDHHRLRHERFLKHLDGGNSSGEEIVDANERKLLLPGGGGGGDPPGGCYGCATPGSYGG